MTCGPTTTDLATAVAADLADHLATLTRATRSARADLRADTLRPGPSAYRTTLADDLAALATATRTTETSTR